MTIVMTVVDVDADGMATAEIPGEAQGITFDVGPLEVAPGDLIQVDVALYGRWVDGPDGMTFLPAGSEIVG